jgi:transcriptional regulator with XRE-family HTH domain
MTGMGVSITGISRLAKELGKSYNMVNSYAQNRRQPSIELLYEIGKILKVDAKELLISSKLLTHNE